MRSLIKNKRGDIPSLIIGLVIILFLVGIVSIVFSKSFLLFTAEFKKQDMISNNTNAMNAVNIVESKTIPFLDYLFFFSFIGVLIGLIISSIYINVHPALGVIFIIFLIVAIVLSGIFANIFVTIGETSELSSTYNSFVLTKAIVTHLPLIILAVGTIIIFVLYGKSKEGVLTA